MDIKDKAKNEAIKLAEEKPEDLPVVEQQAEETRGAGAPQGKLYLGTDVGVFAG